MNQPVELLLRDPRIWRGGDLATTATRGTASGFTQLDQQLPGRGWPTGSVIELLHDGDGLGEMRLLMPSLSGLSQRGGKIALIGPPYLLYAPAWAGAGVELQHLLCLNLAADADRLWAFEQCLRSGACRAALLWLAREPDSRSWRRLQLAAESGNCTGWIILQSHQSHGNSPVGLRLQVCRQSKPQIRILKRRGTPLHDFIPLPELDAPFQRSTRRCRAEAPATLRLIGH